MVLYLTLASVLSGAASAALIAVIHRALVPEGRGAGLIAAAFALALLTKSATQYVSQVLLVKFAQHVALRLCRDVCDRVLAAPLDRLEALGKARLLAMLNDDVMVLSGAMLILPSIATNLAVLLGCSIYLIWLSWQVFVLCLAMTAIGVLGYRLLLRRAQSALAAARDVRDRLFGNYRTLIEGVKELKLHAGRRDEFLRLEIDDTTEQLRRTNTAAIHQYLVADVWNQLLFFGLVAMLLFGAPALTKMPTSTLTGYVFAALYIMAPLWALVAAVPTFMRGRISLTKIQELDASLNAMQPERVPGYPARQPEAARIELEGASYAYPAPTSDETGFVLGPIDLTLDPGELVFVTGGNGCGKSTLVRLLTGLYAPATGVIRCNGQVIDADSRESYRQHFSAVFADFYLFERLFGLDAQVRGSEIRRYLAVLGMQNKVSVRDDRLSSTALSTGQRRRLALLTAYLEDRPVYVFDEWAADQDPAYKQIFYTQLLPELKARGKCVVVVTHDDRYFALGDRIIKLEAGRILHAENPLSAPPSPARSPPPFAAECSDQTAGSDS